IYALVLMVRADLLPVDLPELAAGTPAEGGRPVVVMIDTQGDFFVDAEPFEDVDAVIRRLREIRAERPDDPLFLAADREGSTDRLPGFFMLVDRLREAGVGDFAIMGHRPRPASDTAP
ncbi:MAG: ExbD/TolR family protein, partial [Phycisphaerales bacterium JB038]